MNKNNQATRMANRDMAIKVYQFEDGTKRKLCPRCIPYPHQARRTIYYRWYGAVRCDKCECWGKLSPGRRLQEEATADQERVEVKVRVVSFSNRWWQVGAFGPHGCAIGWWSKSRWLAAVPKNVKYFSRFRSKEAAETAATLGHNCPSLEEIRQ